MMLSSRIDLFSQVNILCIGDMMLDHFVYGSIDRISPEAPVPVFNARGEKKCSEEQETSSPTAPLSAVA